MKFHFHNLMVLVLLGQFALANEAVTPEERKAEFAKPRGFSKSSSSSTSNSSGGPTNSSQPTRMAASVADVYSKMGESFSKEITTLSKNFSLPKIQEEPSYLEELGKARDSLDSSTDPTTGSSSSLIAQYTEAFIATLQELTKMQIEFEISKTNRQIKNLKNKSPNHTPSVENSITPSPISLRTRISTPQGNGKGLFPSELDTLRAKAYNPPK
jgi:pectate lyase